MVIINTLDTTKSNGPDGISARILKVVDDISLSPGSKISLYTDHMMLVKIINSNTDYADVQNDIDGLNYWVTTNHLPFSSSKYKYMLLSRRKSIASTCPETWLLCSRQSLLIQIPLPPIGYNFYF